MDEEQIAVRGIVTAVEWNEAGGVTRVSIHTRDEHEYLVDTGGPARALLDSLTREVLIWGRMGRLPDGRRVLRPASYALIDP
jgi:hypothetical protein